MTPPNSHAHTGELETVDTANDTTKDRAVNGHDTPVDSPIIALLQEQVQDLKAQLTKAEERESKLHNLLKEEQANMRALMPAADMTKPNWWQRLTGR